MPRACPAGRGYDESEEEEDDLEILSEDETDVANKKPLSGKGRAAEQAGASAAAPSLRDVLKRPATAAAGAGPVPLPRQTSGHGAAQRLLASTEGAQAVKAASKPPPAPDRRKEEEAAARARLAQAARKAAVPKGRVDSGLGPYNPSEYAPAGSSHRQALGELKKPAIRPAAGVAATGALPPVSGAEPGTGTGKRPMPTDRAQGPSSRPASPAAKRPRTGSRAPSAQPEEPAAASDQPVPRKEEEEEHKQSAGAAAPGALQQQPDAVGVPEPGSEAAADPSVAALDAEQQQGQEPPVQVALSFSQQQLDAQQLEEAQPQQEMEAQQAEGQQQQREEEEAQQARQPVAGASRLDSLPAPVREALGHLDAALDSLGCASDCLQGAVPARCRPPCP